MLTKRTAGGICAVIRPCATLNGVECSDCNKLYPHLRKFPSRYSSVKPWISSVLLVRLGHRVRWSLFSPPLLLESQKVCNTLSETTTWTGMFVYSHPNIMELEGAGDRIGIQLSELNHFRFLDYASNWVIDDWIVILLIYNYARLGECI